MVLLVLAYSKVQGSIWVRGARSKQGSSIAILGGVEGAFRGILQGKLMYHFLHQLLSHQRDVGVTAG